MTEGPDAAEPVGAWLRKQREAAGLSQEDIADRSGLSVRAISDLERGRTHRPYPKSLRRLGDALGLRETGGQARVARRYGAAVVVMAFDDSVDLRDILQRIAAFFKDESCGQCVPCRVGTVRQEEALHRIATGRMLGSLSREIALLDEVGMAMRDASICGLGQTAYAAVESAIHRLELFKDTQP